MADTARDISMSYWAIAAALSLVGCPAQAPSSGGAAREKPSASVVQSVAPATGDLAILQAGKWTDKKRPKSAWLFKPDMTYRAEETLYDTDGTYELDGGVLTMASVLKAHQWKLEELSSRRLVVSKLDDAAQKTEYSR